MVFVHGRDGQAIRFTASSETTAAESVPVAASSPAAPSGAAAPSAPCDASEPGRGELLPVGAGEHASESKAHPRSTATGEALRICPTAHEDKALNSKFGSAFCPQRLETG